MRRFCCFLLLILLLVSVFSFTVTAVHEPFAPHIRCVQPLRAGGGSSSGGGGGGSSGGSSHSSTAHNTGSGNRNGQSNPLAAIVGIFSFLLFSCGGALLYRFKLSKHARNTKKLLRMLEKQDRAWKYKSMQGRVKEAYFAIQHAWTRSDMSAAAGYMSAALLQSFQTRLNWMTYKNQRNVLKRIRLREAVPVALHDSEDDTKDHVWFYIRGSMVDYMMDTESGERISGETAPQAFEEYWQFTRRTDDGCWVLHQILQKDESDRIQFAEAD